MWYPVIGSRVYVQTALGPAITATAMTNTNPPAVTTSAAHSLADLEEVVGISSGWEEVEGSVFRIDATDATHFNLVGFNGTNTEWYPSGSAGSTFKKVTTWLQIGQVTAVSGGGGDGREITDQPIDRRTPVRKIVGFNSSKLDFTVGFDPQLAAQVELMTATDGLESRAIKFILPGNAYAYCYGNVAMNPLPTFDTNSFMKRNVSIGILGKFTFYNA